jgi:hypothetical protein
VIVGPFRAEQLIDLGVIAGSLVLLLLVMSRSPKAEATAGSAAG